MLGVEIPFVVVGVIMTVRRLRDAGLSLWLAVLFFIPFVNLLFFGILSLLPSLPVAGVATAPGGEMPQARRAAEGRVGFLDRIMPLSDGASFLVSSLCVLPLGPMTVGLGVFVLRNDGWGLFVGLPFVAALLATVLHTRPREAVILVVRGGEHPCPLFVRNRHLLLRDGGGSLPDHAPPAGDADCRGRRGRRILDPVPAGTEPARVSGGTDGIGRPSSAADGAERLVRPEARLFSVTTSVEVHAPPEAVWRNVVSFSEIAPPKDWFFATGVAYP